MKHLIVLISLFVISFSFSQKNEIKIKVFIKMELDSTCFRKQKLYSKEENGIIFNNECKSGGSFLFSDQRKSDTISISKLKKYKISSIENIESIENKWRNDRFKEVQEKNKKERTHTLPYHIFDKNYIFETFIIEIISKEKFVIYPVTWRGQGVKQ